MAIRDPELDVVLAALLRAFCEFVVVGGFAVIAHRHVRATEDVDLLIPDDDANDRRVLEALSSLEAITTSTQRPPAARDLASRAHLRVLTRAGLVDLIREGDPPLDYATVATHAITADLGDGLFKIAGLRTLVAMKRLADRPRDRLDLEALEEQHGPLPLDPLPGLDDR
ncbi:MAG: hypothetical protein M3401_10875 [Actinomycetota bacterium]|nr:hypothetical protein [Actinomycetota bacterium]